MKKLVKSAVWI